MLGCMFEVGACVDKDPNVALTWYRLASAQHHSLSSVKLGTFYQDGRAVEKDETRAVELYKEAADADCAAGHYYMSLAYHDGIGGLEKNPSESYKECEKAAAEDYPPALFRMAYFYEDGAITGKNPDMAREYLLEAASFDFPEALYRLGEIYRYGENTNKNLKKSFKYFKRAAERGFPPAFVQVGLAYENGIGVDVDMKEASSFYTKGMIKKDMSAACCLAVCHLNHSLGEPNQELGYGLLLYAAEHHDVRAMCLYALRERRSHIDGDKEKEFLLESARNDYPEAMTAMGELLLEGKVFPRSTERAFYYLQRAVSKGDLMAKFVIADAHFSNKINRITDKVAIEYLKETANAGHTRSMMKLAKCYSNGYGVKKDDNEAYIWYRRVADEPLKPRPSFLANEKDRILYASHQRQAYAAMRTGQHLNIFQHRGLGSEKAKEYFEKASVSIPEAKAALAALWFYGNPLMKKKICLSRALDIITDFSDEENISATGMEYIIQIMGEFLEDYSYRWFDMKRHRRIYVPAMYYTSSSDVAIIRNNLTKYLKSNNPYIRIAFGLAIEAEYASKMPEKRYKKVVAFMKIPASVYKESYIHFQKAIGDDTPEALFYAGRALLFSAESDEDRKKSVGISGDRRRCVPYDGGE